MTRWRHKLFPRILAEFTVADEEFDRQLAAIDRALRDEKFDVRKAEGEPQAGREILRVMAGSAEEAPNWGSLWPDCSSPISAGSLRSRLQPAST
jgi:hypothetical protein